MGSISQNSCEDLMHVCKQAARLGCSPRIYLLLISFRTFLRSHCFTTYFYILLLLHVKIWFFFPRPSINNPSTGSQNLVLFFCILVFYWPGCLCSWLLRHCVNLLSISSFLPLPSLVLNIVVCSLFLSLLYLFFDFIFVSLPQMCRSVFLKLLLVVL